MRVAPLAIAAAVVSVALAFALQGAHDLDALKSNPAGRSAPRGAKAG